MHKIRDKIHSFFESVPCPLPKLPEEALGDCLSRSGYKSLSSAIEKTVNKNNSDSEYGPSEEKPQSEDGPQSEDASPSIILPSTCVLKKSSQKLFDNDEYNAFWEQFKDRICSNKSITRALLTERLEGPPKLCHLLKRCTLLLLADKVRTEWRSDAKKWKYITLNSVHS